MDDPWKIWKGARNLNLEDDMDWLHPFPSILLKGIQYLFSQLDHPHVIHRVQENNLLITRFAKK